MMDAVERQWHTASICAAVRGEVVEDWSDVVGRFEEWLTGETQPLTEEQEKRRLLGLG